MEIIKTYSLYLNSRFATYQSSGNSNNITYNINPAITLSNNKNRFLVCCETCEVPYSFNQISSSYNTLQYSYTNSIFPASNYNSSLVIPVGNYNVNNLISTFISLLVADVNIRDPSLSFTNNNLAITYNTNTSLITFAVIDTPGVSFTLKFSLNYVLAVCFGFPQVDQTFSITALVSSNKINVNPVSAIYLRSDTLKFSTSFEAIVAPYTQADILVKIPVPTLPNTIIHYRGDQKQMLSNTEISSLNFYWTDNLDTGFNPIDLRGLNYGIYLTFSEVQIKPNNEGLDKLTAEGVAVPKSLIDSRDKLLQELLESKLKLEKEVADAAQALEAKKKKQEHSEQS
jgi:hypothetical protein